MIIKVLIPSNKYIIEVLLDFSKIVLLKHATLR